MKKLYSFVIIIATFFYSLTFAQAQMDLPVNFNDTATVNYSTIDFGNNGGAVTTLNVVDPTGGPNLVAQTVKSAGADFWSGTTLAIPGTPSDTGFVNPIPFTGMETMMTVRVYSPTLGIPVRLKVEDATDPGISVEVDVMTTTSNAWETLSFDFSNQVGGTAPLNLANTYDKATIFFNFDPVTGAGTGETYYWDDVEFAAAPPVVKLQMDLPVNFNDTATVNYSTIDFGNNGGAVTTLNVVDPTGGPNLVAQTVKSAGADFWSGTTLAIPGTPSDTGFVNPIPFTGMETMMTVRVYSPTLGIPVRLKVEDATDPGISVEVDVMTTTANAWETLSFDFSNQVGGTAPLNLANTYDKATIFFNFDPVTGAGTGETYYWDDVEFAAAPPVVKLQMDLPVNFNDTATVNYSTIDFGNNGGAVTTLNVVDPTGGPNLVAQTVKSAGADFWSGTTLAIPGTPSDTGFVNPIPFTGMETMMTVRVYSPTLGIPVRLKVEDATDPGISVEVDVMTTTSNAWETLSFDFSNQVGGTAPLNLANTYDKATIFFNFDPVTGAGTGETYYWDDVEFAAAPPVVKLQMDLPVNFNDTATVNYSTIDFGNNGGAVTTLNVVDPTGGPNLVAQTVKSAGADFWSGTTLAIPGTPSDTGFVNPIPFTGMETMMTVRVYSPTLGIPVRLKVEDATDPGISVEVDVMTTTSNAWETLSFDFSNQVGGTAPLNLANTYDKATIFFNFDPVTGAGTGETYYWDDVEFAAAPPVVKLQMDLPINFNDTATVNYSTIDFGNNGGAVTTLNVVDPTGGPNLVAQTVKSAGADFWSGTTLAIPGTPSDTGFVNPIPFTGMETMMTVRVYSPTLGIPVRLKVEDATDPGISVEVDVMTTTSNAWETLSFDFSNQVGGTAPLNLANTYDKATIFFNFDPATGAGMGETYYWDDVEFLAAPPTNLTQMDLPVTFDDVTVDYSTIDFGNTISVFTVDPTNASNNVVQTEKSVGAELWAGTTLALPGIGFPPGTLNVDTGFLNLIPFSAGNTTMSVRVYSTGPGIPVRLKVELDTNVTMTCETEATTTGTNAWETLVFDFSNQVSGTAALNFASTYNKASLFYNFGSLGLGEVFYWDDVEFGGTPNPPSNLAQMDLPVTFDDTANINYSTIDFGNNGGAVTTLNVVDPTGGPNLVAQTVKSMGADFWSGTTLGYLGTPNDSGFVNPIPFTLMETTMTVKVYSPTIGIPVRLKVEDATDGAISVEVDVMTTMANAWETLTFDFSNQVGGTPALDIANNYDKASIFFNFDPANGTGMGETYYWDDVEFGGTSVSPCTGVTPDPLILDDFECQGNITYTFMNATWTEDVANPDMSGINTTALVGEFIHWGAGTDGAFGGSLDLGPIDISSDNLLKMDVWTNASALPITVVLQDGNTTPVDIQAQTLSTSATGSWETLEFDMSASASNTDISNIVFVVNPGTNDQDTLYIDNVRFDGATAAPCAGVTPDASILDDYECQGNITYTFMNATWTEDVANPNPSGINTTSMVGEFIHWGAGTDGAFGGDLDLAPLDLSIIGSELKMDVHPSAAGLPITVVLQDGSGADLDLQTATTTGSGAWETLTYNMSAASTSSDVSRIVFVVAPGDSTQHVVYFDNIRLDTNSIVGNCPGVTPDPDIMEDFDCQRNTTYTSVHGNLNVITNPDPSGINTSDNVGEYTRGTASTDEISGDLDLGPLDFTTHNQIQLDVWDADAPSEVTVILKDAAGIFLESATMMTSVSSEWEQLNFDFQTVPFTISVEKTVIQFDEGSQVDSNKVYYFDNFKLDGFVTGIKDVQTADLLIYPNPVNYFVTVDLSSIQDKTELNVKIVSIDGKQVDALTLNGASNSETIDVSALSSGLYYIELSDTKTKWVAKFSKN